MAKVVFAWPDWSGRVHRDGGQGPTGAAATATAAAASPAPALILAADHRARGVITIEPYADYLGARSAEALAHLRRHPGDRPAAAVTWPAAGAHPTRPPHLSVDQPDRAGRLGLRARRPAGGQRGPGRRRRWTGIKLMTRIDLADPVTAPPHWRCSGQVLEEARAPGLEALIEPLSGATGGWPATPTRSCLAAVVAHDLGRARAQGAGPRRGRRAEPGSRRWPGSWPAWGCRSSSSGVRTGPTAPTASCGEVRDVMAGGGAGLAIGRAILEESSRPVWPQSAWRTSCTPGDPHRRPRHRASPRSACGARTAGWPTPGGRSGPPIHDRAGPSRTPPSGGPRWSRPASEVEGPGAGGVCRGGRGGLHGRPPDVRTGGRRRPPLGRPSAGRTAGRGARPAGWPRRLRVWEGPRPRAGSPSTQHRLPPSSAGWRSNRPDLLAAASWVLTPRDLVTHRLTGMVATDPTMASRSGLYDLDGRLDPALAGEAAVLLPPGCRRTASPDPSPGRRRRRLGLAGGLPVVIGAGDRAVRGARLRGGRGAVRWSVGARRPTSRSRSVTGRLGRRPAWCCPGRPTGGGCWRVVCRRPDPWWRGSGAWSVNRPRRWPSGPR